MEAAREQTFPRTLDVWVAHQYAGEALREVLGAFEREGIDALPVKGIVSARTLYADVAERPISDVDVRIRPVDLGRVKGVARRHGWPIWRNSKQLGSRGLEVRRTLVEIETTIGAPGLCAVTVDEMLRRSHSTRSGLGFEHREPELHDHALVLCVNAFKDKLDGTPPWAREDLARIVRVPGFSVARLALLARQGKVETLVWIVADWLLRRHGAGDEWRAVRNALRLTRPGYARAFRALSGSRFAFGWASGILARGGSDAISRRVGAIVLGAAGTMMFEVAAWHRRYKVEQGGSGAGDSSDHG